MQLKNLLGMGGPMGQGNLGQGQGKGQDDVDEWDNQDQPMAQWMREREREKGDGSGGDSHFGSSSRSQQWNSKIGQMGGQVQGLGQGQGQQGSMKLSNSGGRMSAYAQAPPPLGKNKSSESTFMPQSLIEWTESHLGAFANKPELRGILEYCYKTENPAEVRDCFIKYFGSNNQVLQMYIITYKSLYIRKKKSFFFFRIFFCVLFRFLERVSCASRSIFLPI